MRVTGQNILICLVFDCVIISCVLIIVLKFMFISSSMYVSLICALMSYRFCTFVLQLLQHHAPELSTDPVLSWTRATAQTMECISNGSGLLTPTSPHRPTPRTMKYQHICTSTPLPQHRPLDFYLVLIW